MSHTNGAVFMNPDQTEAYQVDQALPEAERKGVPFPTAVNPGNIDKTFDGVGYKLGSAFQPGAKVEPPLPPKDVQDLVTQIQSYRRMTLQGLPNDRSTAILRLQDVAAREYGRPDGGRLEIKQALNAAGIEKPAAVRKA